MNLSNILSLANLISQGGKQASETAVMTVQQGGISAGSAIIMILHVCGLIALFYFFSVYEKYY